MKFIVRKLAKWTGVGQELFDEGWDAGYDDCSVDVQEALDKTLNEAGVPNLGYFQDDDNWKE